MRPRGVSAIRAFCTRDRGFSRRRGAARRGSRMWTRPVRRGSSESEPHADHPRGTSPPSFFFLFLLPLPLAHYLPSLRARRHGIASSSAHSCAALARESVGRANGRPTRTDSARHLDSHVRSDPTWSLAYASASRRTPPELLSAQRAEAGGGSGFATAHSSLHSGCDDVYPLTFHIRGASVNGIPQLDL